MAEDTIREFLEDREVHSQDFKVEVSEAEPFIFEWHSHSRPGPSYSGSEYTDYKTDGAVTEIETDRYYSYPCNDDRDYKVSVSGWTWLLRYCYRQYATDDMSYESLVLTVKDTAVAAEIVSIVSDCLEFGLQEAKPSNTDDVTDLVRAFLSKEASFADLREAVK